MGKTVAIAFNTYLEARRNRILAIFLFFAVGLMIVSGVAASLAIGETEKIMRDLGLFGINIFGLLVALFVGIGLVYNDIDRRTIYTVISKPIARGNFVFGKYLGLLLTIYVATVLMTWFFFLVLHFSGYLDPTRVFRWIEKKYPAAVDIEPLMLLHYYGVHLWKAGWDALASFYLWAVPQASLAGYSGHVPYIDVYIDAAKIAATTSLLFEAILLSCLELAVVTAFAVLFSVISTPFLAFFFTFVMWVIGRLNLDIMRFADHLMRKKEWAELTIGEQVGVGFAHLAATLAPNLTVFNQRYEVIYEGALPGVPFMAASAAYGVGYSLIVLSLAVFIFNRRSFK